MNLQLSLKTKWFKMTHTPDGKSEDYREINEYWVKRIFRNVDKNSIAEIIKDLKQGKSIDWIGIFHLHFTKDFKINTMTLGYPKKTDRERFKIFEHAGIEIRTGNPEWGAEPGKLYFVIKHGKRIQ
jgi:hypothetical protein